MKRFMLVAVALAVVVGTGAAWSALAAPSSAGALVGGGHFDSTACFTGGTVNPCPIGFTRDFSFDVQAGANGTASGTVLYGTNGTSSSTHQVTIYCMTVAGNAAVVGGTDPSSPGDAVLFWVVDNGGPGNDASYDQVSPESIEVAPAGFPKKCGNMPAATASYFGYTNLLEGDISIH